MREIVVISGKGGTGKTSVTAAFAHIGRSGGKTQAVICDLDVDAPDLHLLLQPRPVTTHQFASGHEARILPETCTACGECASRCRFQAICVDGAVPYIDPLKCEGCNVCVTFCPVGAIAFEPKVCGTWHRSQTRFGPMVHALLRPGEENSGRLVALLRDQARHYARANGLDLILADGPPGIGCPAISALTGVHLAVVVAEPTPSGRHDFHRAVELCQHFKLNIATIINKADLNPQLNAALQQDCRRMHIPVIAELRHDMAFTHALMQAQTVTEFKDGALAAKLRRAWADILTTNTP